MTEEMTGDFPALVPALQSEEIVESARNKAGEYNLTRIPPERVERIARYLAGNVPIIRICRELSVSPSTVYAVRNLRPEVVEKEKERLGRRMWFLSDLAIGALEEKIAAGECPANVLSFTLGLSADKGLSLMGQATARVEHIKSEPAGPELVETLRRIAAEAREKRAQVIEIEPAPDSAAGGQEGKGQ